MLFAPPANASMGRSPSGMSPDRPQLLRVPQLPDAMAV